MHPHVYLSFDIMFLIVTLEELGPIGGRHRPTLRITLNDDLKADSDSLFTPDESLRVAFKAAVSTENIETSVIDRSHPYLDCLLLLHPNSAH